MFFLGVLAGIAGGLVTTTGQRCREKLIPNLGSSPNSGTLWRSVAPSRASPTELNADGAELADGRGLLRQETETRRRWAKETMESVDPGFSINQDQRHSPRSQKKKLSSTREPKSKGWMPGWSRLHGGPLGIRQPRGAIRSMLEQYPCSSWSGAFPEFRDDPKFGMSMR
jgi:hypothetical protein